MPEFVDVTVKQIDERLRELETEVTRLERARAALTADGVSRVRSAGSNGRSTRGRGGATSTPRGRRGGNTRADQALELVRGRPGITIPEIAQAMKIQPNYLYRVLPRLASEGQVSRQGEGWHPASEGAPAAASSGSSRPSRRARAAGSRTSSRGSRGRRSAASGTTGRAAPGGTTSSVLAVLASGEAMTATEVAAKAGLARPTVSTTLSKLARGGRVEKAQRGYRLAPAA